MKKSIFILMVLAMSQLLHSQDTLLVPEQYTTIQSALNEATENSTILVSAGTYYENLVWPVDVDKIKLLSVDGSASTIIDGGNAGRVITMEPTIEFDSQTILSGFTIQNGQLTNQNGAGINVIRSSPTLSDLVIQNNVINGNSHGVGLNLETFEGTISNCSFLNNKLIGNEINTGGAGMYVSIKLYVVLEDCVFERNEVSGDTGWGDGGALYVTPQNLYEGRVEIHNCVFQENVVREQGGAIFIQDYNGIIHLTSTSSSFTNNIARDGGGIYFRGWKLDIFDTNFSRNVAEYGAGINIENIWTGSYSQRANIVRSQFINNKGIESVNLNAGVAIYYWELAEINFTNSIIAHNKLGSPFAGLFTSNTSVCNFDHCTIAYNDHPILLRGAEVNLENSILWNPEVGEQIQMSSSTGNPNIVTANSCISYGGIDGEGIIEADPEFINQHLLIPSITSPAIGNGSLSSSVSDDFLENPRPLPLGSPPDIGAYEVGQSLAVLRVQFYYDINENGIQDDGEDYLSIGSINVQEDKILNNFRTQGIYLSLDTGPLTVSYDESAGHGWHVTSQETFNFDIDSGDFSESIVFGLFPDTQESNIYSFMQHDNFRCGEEVNFVIAANNLGSNIESDVLWLSMDPRLEDFTFEIDPDFQIGDNQFGWDLVDLYPFNSFEVKFTVTAPLIVDESQVGELYTFKTSIDDDQSRSSNCIDVELRCAYDPNDKQVNPSRPDSHALIDDFLQYTVRFQNTGNDYARNVVLRDTIDFNLDISTFSVIGSSHEDLLNVIIEDNNAVTFEFKDIFLPDSLTNLEGSNGHVTYIIKALDDVSEYTQISNTAFIYFDFNPPIVTNTVNSVMVEEFPISSTLDIIVDDINMFPNPTSSLLYFGDIFYSGYIESLRGERVLSFNKTNFINCSSLSSGVYFVTLNDNKGKILTTKKFVKL